MTKYFAGILAPLLLFSSAVSAHGTHDGSHTHAADGTHIDVRVDGQPSTAMAATIPQTPMFNPQQSSSNVDDLPVQGESTIPQPPPEVKEAVIKFWSEKTGRTPPVIEAVFDDKVRLMHAAFQQARQQSREILKVKLGVTDAQIEAWSLEEHQIVDQVLNTLGTQAPPQAAPMPASVPAPIPAAASMNTPPVENAVTQMLSNDAAPAAATSDAVSITMGGVGTLFAAIVVTLLL